MVSLYGWSPKGERCHGSAPHGHWHNSTIVAAIRADGVTAPMVLDGPMDGKCFLAYVECMLVPQLLPGDIVVMDNLSSHKGEAISEAITGVGAEVWYLPPYSPDLNPIEKMWSKTKQFLRRAGARTFEDLIIAIRDALNTVTLTDIEGWITSCGYQYT